MRKKSIPKYLKSRLAKIHFLTQSEMKGLLSVISDLRDRALFLIAYRHGLRASEVSQMETADVDLSKTTVRIRRVGRGNHGYHPLQNDEAASLRQYLKTRTDQSVVLFLGGKGKAISRRGLDWLMKTYADKAGLPAEKRHFHVLKHSVAVHLLAGGMALAEVHEWLGHTALQNTTLYLYLVPS